MVKTILGGPESASRDLSNVCVYCGSASGGDPRFAAAAQTFGAALAAAEIGLVYGGGGHGLMGTLAGAVLDAGGRVTGITPHALARYVAPSREGFERIMVADMHARKRLMFDMADGFVALPGGLGTLEELVEQLTWVSLGHHDKPVVLADIGGFWRPLIHLLDHMRAQGFIWLREAPGFVVADTADEILPALRSALASAS